MSLRNQYLTVAAFSLLIPVALALILFPSPQVDVREVLAWGRHFQLMTHKHPPMQYWAGGIVDLTFGPSNAAAIFFGQILNAIAAVYVYATLRLASDRDIAMLVAFLVATSAYFVIASLSFALNAEVLQLPIWAAVIFHFVRAWQTDRIWHWLALGIWAAAALWTKYTGILLFVSMAAATVIVPEFRRIWRSPRFYLSAGLALVLLAPSLVALWYHREAIGYGGGLFHPEFGLVRRLYHLADMIGGLLLFLAPGWAILLVGRFRRDLKAERPATDQTKSAIARFLLVLFLAYLIAILAIILVIGFLYHRNYNGAFIVLLPLAVGPWIAFSSGSREAVLQRIAITVAAITALAFAAAVIVYGIFTAHDIMQEPLDDAGAIIRADWASRYPCGPAYILGDRRSSHGIAIVGDLKPAGLPLDNITVAPWYEPERLKREGAIVVYLDRVNRDELSRALPGVQTTEEKTITLPLTDTFHRQSLTYGYVFIPPESCDVPAPN